MKLPQLLSGRLIRRYKRFLADVELANGEALTVHCPNTGAMTGCAEPGSRVWLSESHNERRKYRHTWEIVETPAGMVSVNTGRANALVGEAIETGVLQEFSGALTVRAEAKIPEGNGRFDFLVRSTGGCAWVEVKSTTLWMAEGMGAFPDAVSARALKHLDALITRVRAGDRGVLIFCAQHCGIEAVRAAAEIDPAYAQRLREAADLGVEIAAYGCRTDLHSMQINRRLPVLLT